MGNYATKNNTNNTNNVNAISIQSKPSINSNNNNTNNIKNINNNIKEEDVIYNNMNATQKGKFTSTKNNFGINPNFQNENFINLNANQPNYSKSPPKDSFTINLNINNNPNPILNKYGPPQAQQKQQQNKKFPNFVDGNSTSFNFMINANKGYQTFYNIVKKDDIYNFDIDTNFEEKFDNEKQIECKKIPAVPHKKNMNNLNPNGKIEF